MLDLSPEEMALILRLSQGFAAQDAVTIRLKHSLESKVLNALEQIVKAREAK